ncbi:tetratricopeptide repeat protein [Bacteroides sp. UBA939]|uniref:tetratricopeptide repeat protein n=1 Tax=Bacteroides sp. UBA939 TaxID=1946092 RepID=UPI0025B8FCE1|nr:tetratricopeptide repeat protein [Bacteroides sp. UBA939]
MRKLLTLCCFSVCSLLMAQNTNQIQEAMANYDYETALSLINKETPTVPLLYQKGKALKSLGNNLEALQVYEEIVLQDSLNPRAYIEAAECCKSLAKGSQALNYYREALDLNPDNKYVRIQYVGLLLSQQKFEEALGESSLMSEKDSSAIVLHLQAQSFEGRNEAPAAMGCYYVIQEKYPNDYLAAAKLGALNIAGDFYDQAIEATEKYRKIDSTNIVVNRQNALAYCLNKDYPTAIQRYEYLVNRGDSSFHTCYYLGVSYYAVDKLYEAHDILEVARKYDPENVNLLYYLGRACSKTSWKEQGVTYLESAIKLSIPKDSAMSRLYIGMSDCYKMAGMYKEQVEATLERYKLYDKTNHKLLYDIAFTYQYSLKDKRNTERYLEAFLKTRPLEGKEEQPEIDSQGGIVLDTSNYYNAAESWLKDLREKKKEEEFFQGKGSAAPSK